MSQLTAKQRNALPKSAYAIPDADPPKYPIHDLSHARNALARVAQVGTPEEQAKVRKAVYARYPQLRQAQEATDSRSLPDLPNKKNKTNWVEKAGGLPKYIERIAKHLHHEKGMPLGRAIAIAVNACKRMCASGDVNFPGTQQVNAGSRAQACAAVADWNRKKGQGNLREALLLMEGADDRLLPAGLDLDALGLIGTDPRYDALGDD